MLGDANVAATLPVSDLEEAKKFYEEVLGLKKVNDNPGGVSYKSGDSMIFVYPSEFTGSNKATAAGWLVDDIDSIVSDLKSKGVTFEQYDNLPGTTREGDIHIMGDIRGVWFKDPFGNILSAIEGEM